MKSLFYAIVSIAFYAAALFCIEAASPELPPPQEPWVAPVPEKGHWIVRSISAAENPHPLEKNREPAFPGGAEIPLEIQSTTWNTVKRDIFRFADGRSKTLFYYAGFVLVEGQSSRGDPAPVLVQQLPGTDFSTLRSGGWLGMDWLEEKHYVGPVFYQSAAADAGADPVLCYFFQKPEGNLPGSETWMPELRAWIRGGDLQPVALGFGNQIFEFQRLAPPTAAPEMNPEQAARLLELKDQNERMQRLRERNQRFQGS